MSVQDAAALLRAGDLAGAEKAIDRQLAAYPGDIAALNIRAMVRHQRGDIAGAIEALGAAIAVDASDVHTHFNRATLLHQAGRLEEAVHGYVAALQLEPRDVTAWVQRATAERALGRHEDVVRSCQAALEIDPRNPQALSEMATALGRLKRFDEALAMMDRLLYVSPDSAPAHANRGKILSGLGRYEDAVMAYKFALDVNPKHAPAWNNLGVAYAALGRHAEAIAAYERAAQGENQNFDAGHPLFNIATALLLLGDYTRGFVLYAQRFAANAASAPPGVEAAPAWGGERVEGVLRVRGEQAVGDQLLFTRLLPLVLERTARVAVDCDPRIAALLKRGYPELEAVLAPGDVRGDVSAHVAMGDLAGVLGATAQDIAPMPVRLSADAEKAAALRAKYAGMANGRPVVGVAWASPRAKSARSKGALLAEWGALLREPYLFVSLQYGDGRAEIEAARDEFGGEIVVDESIDQVRSIEDFAAQIAALDHVVTVSNTTAHVAGALGVRTLVLAPPAHGLHWYWGASGETTPWYPSLTLVRRALGAAWEGQIAAAAGLVRNALLL